MLKKDQLPGLVKKRISNAIVSLIKTLHKLDTRFTQNFYNPNPKGYADLTPRSNIDEDGTYAEAIQWALRNNEIKNIALTGPYGSGKSSILKSFENKHKECTYLNIFLATLL